MRAASSNPNRAGGLFALLSALAFGVTIPAVQALGRGVGPASTATLLYAGATLATVRARGSARSSLSTRRFARLGVSAFFGAFLAPSLLAWGLQHANGTSANLLLNLEAPFTAVLAWALYREALGGQALLALALMVSGAAVLVLGASPAGHVSVLGLAAILGATLGWALDNAVARPLADQDARVVVRWKGILGATLGLLVALVRREPPPPALATLGLMVCGATGYGLSLQLYLVAQRRIGAGRTASIFAIAPFFGAGVAFVVSPGSGPGPMLALAVPLLALGTYLHLTERHTHRHTHEVVEHEHAHRHDDGHHDHVHEVDVMGEHTHPHRHTGLTHDHPHAPDVHHRHSHS